MALLSLNFRNKFVMLKGPYCRKFSERKTYTGRKFGKRPLLVNQMLKKETNKSEKDILSFIFFFKKKA